MVKKFASGLLFALVLVNAWATAEAVVIQAQDDDIEFLFTPGVGGPVPGLIPKTSGTIAVGDVLVAIMEFPSFSVDGVSQIFPGTEITGAFVGAVTSISGSTPGSTITFGPYSGGFNVVTGATVPGGAAGGGAMVAVFRNDLTFNLNIDPAAPGGLTTNCTGYLQCIGEATAGSLLQVDGFSGDPDEFWVATLIAPGALDVGTVRGLESTALVAGFNAALTTIFNAIPGPGSPILFKNIGTGAPCPTGSSALDGCVAGPTLSGTVTGGSGLATGLLNDGAFARSDADGSKLTVPGPATLGLIGLGLLAAAVLGRRRQVASGFNTVRIGSAN